jgi:hypothetical protein
VKIFASILLLAALVTVQANPFLIAFGSPPTATCPADGSPSSQTDQSTQAYRCGQTTDDINTGMSGWNDGGTPRTICKLAFETTAINGDVSAKTYTAKIYTLSGANLGALQATSDNVTGVAAAGWIVFQFSTPFTTSASTSYALIFGPASADASNFVWVPATDSDNIAGHREIFNSAGAADFGGGNDTDQSIRIYWQ